MSRKQNGKVFYTSKFQEKKLSPCENELNELAVQMNYRPNLKQLKSMVDSAIRKGFFLQDMQRFCESWYEHHDRFPTAPQMLGWLFSNCKTQQQLNGDSHCSTGVCDGSGWVITTFNEERVISGSRAHRCSCKVGHDSFEKEKKEILELAR